MALGGVIDGMPAGVVIDMDAVQHELRRRRPGQSDITTARSESDTITVLSGMMDGRTTGTPIGFTIANVDQHSSDYEDMRHIYRPSHADYTYQCKYGIRDHRGGGRSSARTTVSIVAAGAFARQALNMCGISVAAFTSQVGPVKASMDECMRNIAATDSNAVRCPDAHAARMMEEYIRGVKADGDTVGGIITGVINGCPAGLGEPVFDKLQARLAAAMLSINAAHGFDYGMGFDGCCARGSEMIDRFVMSDHGEVLTSTNHSGGIQGGISNGMPVVWRVAFKPVATLLQPVDTVNDCGEAVTLKARGRHDPCVLPRAVPVVEAMAAITMLDMMLIHGAYDAFSAAPRCRVRPESEI
ncbi:MAG: chorismate synthase [Muribaculaceae bacterium]|nr:chorismate synthase [Muribaculaceae bacterium]